MEDLALEVGEVDAIVIDETDFADAGGGEIHRDGRAETSGPEAEDTRGLEAALAFGTDFGEGEMAGVTRTLRFRKRVLRGSGIRDEGDHSQVRMRILDR